ncbi:MAG TPA: hypothetical protein VFI17_09810 [Solirubrobacterales bacterium]|nr:hypothetical protein [Solirubrobacterales bacterium]
MPDPFPDPPISTITFSSIISGHKLIYLGAPFTGGHSLTMDWEPANGHSRVWQTERKTTAAKPDPFPIQGAERTFATIKGNIQVVNLFFNGDSAGALSPPLTLGFEPGSKRARVWLLDRGAAEQAGVDVDYLLPKLNESFFSTIGPGHELTYLDFDAVLDWEPASGHTRIWRLDRSRADLEAGISAADPLPTKLAETTFSTIRSGHELVYLSGDTVLDRERSTGLLRVWRYDRNVSSGDFLPDSLHEATVPGRFAADEQLLYIGGDRVLAFLPSTGVARVFDYDRVPVEDTKQLALDDVEQRSLPWVTAAVEAVGPEGTSPPAGVLPQLQTHFRFQSASIGEAAALDQIRKTLTEARDALADMSQVKALTKREMKAREPGKYNAASTFPRGNPNEGTAISPEYRRWGFTGGSSEGRGDELRAAIMIHEAVHFVDPNGKDAATEAEKKYDTISADQAIHNPSTYATFARHVATEEELRFGKQPWR